MTRARVREAMARDSAAIASIYAPVVRDSAISFEADPPSAEEMEKRRAGTCARFPFLVCEVDDVVAGYAYAGPHRARQAYQWSAEVSVYVASDRREAGVGRALYGALLEGLEAQGYYGVYAGITLPNAASVALHQSMGFRAAGVFERVGFKFGQWWDVAWWQCWLGEKRENLAPPRTFARIRSQLQLTNR